MWDLRYYTKDLKISNSYGFGGLSVAHWGIYLLAIETTQHFLPDNWWFQLLYILGLCFHNCSSTGANQSRLLLANLLHLQCSSNMVLWSTIMTSCDHWFPFPFNRNDASSTPRWTGSVVHEIITLCSDREWRLADWWLLVDTFALGQRSLSRIHLIFRPVATEAFCIRKLNFETSGK